jgi:hypothetical protein
MDEPRLAVRTMAIIVEPNIVELRRFLTGNNSIGELLSKY